MLSTCEAAHASSGLALRHDVAHAAVDTLVVQVAAPARSAQVDWIAHREPISESSTAGIISNHTDDHIALGLVEPCLQI